MKYIEKIQKFMYGRYGPDDLYHFLFKLYFFLFVIDIFVDFPMLGYIELLIVVVMFYRFFSKKIYKRSDENRLFLKYKKKFIRPFKGIVKKIDNIIKNVKDKNYIYKKCHKCGTVLRLPLPSNYGVKKVKCPKCKRKFRVLCLKKEKIEVIKKGGK